MNASPTFQSGLEHEQHALDHLQAHGLELLTRNYRCRIGEIDLIVQDGDTTVFVEVRYRKSGRHGGALASIHHGKAWRIARTAQAYLKACGAPADTPIRFDVVAIDGEPPRLSWVRAAFEF
ncbi:MAG: YraN family protein [Pseudomonadota bacterium]